MAFVYCITNAVNGKMYVGMTSQTIAQRWSGHVTDRFDGRYISNALCKHGLENFDVSILAEVDTNEKALQLENIWICLLNTADRDTGYNLTYGGEQGFPTDRVREKYSEVMKRRWLDPAFRELMKTKRTGLKHTEESKARIGLAIKKCHEDPAFSEKRFTPEARLKISEANRNRDKSRRRGRFSSLKEQAAQLL